MSTETVAPVGFTYEPGDPSDIPSRPRYIGPGRPSTNPHVEAVKANAGTGEVVRFTVPDVEDDDERRKLINRHARFIRIAARSMGRGARIGATRLNNGQLQIAFQDIEHVPRKSKNADENAPTESGE